MPGKPMKRATSGPQRRAAGAALASHVGAMPKKHLYGAAKQMAGSMTTTQLRELAKKPKKKKG